MLPMQRSWVRSLGQETKMSHAAWPTPRLRNSKIQNFKILPMDLMEDVRKGGVKGLLELVLSNYF